MIFFASIYYASIIYLRLIFLYMTKNKIIKSSIDYTSLSVNLGTLHLFDNYIIAEFNEGVDINFENFSEVTEIIKSTYKDQPFGFIGNRVNSYSMDLKDAELYNKTFPNLKAYAVVAYKALTHRVFEIENRFFDFNREAFNNLEDAISWVEDNLSSFTPSS